MLVNFRCFFWPDWYSLGPSYHSLCTSILGEIIMLRPGVIIGFFGLLGSGKTMGMTRLLYKEYASGRDVVCNYSTAFATRVRSIPALNGLYDTAIALDEVQSFANSRTYSSKQNLEFSEWIEIRIRKRGNVLFYTAQSPNMVEKNLRDLTSYFYFHSFVRYGSEDASRVDVFETTMLGSLTPRGAFMLLHRPHYPLYNTHDDDVKLSATAPASGGPVRGPARRSEN
jgi:hypothetical protein